MPQENAQKRFKNAVGILVDEKDRIQNRLLVAYASQLSGVDPKHDLPDSMAPLFAGLQYALSDAEIPYGFGEHAAKKIHDMSEDEASKLARGIFTMFLQLHGLQV
jgi:hypothetical protein